MTDPKDIWKEDATEFNPEKESEVLYRQPAEIQRYLRVGVNDHYHYLIGPKGVGKSMLLRQKAHLYLREANSSYINAAGAEITENIGFTQTISVRELTKFTDEDIWNDIWVFCIYVVLLKSVKADLPQALTERLGAAVGLSSLLAKVVEYRSDLKIYLAWISDLEGLMATYVTSGIVLCIDSIDVAFLGVLRNTTRNDYKNGEQPDAVKVWTYCQNGAVQAAHKINERYAHVKILVTLRTEAFNFLHHHLTANYRAKAIILEFNKTELREMFERKVRLMPKSYLVSPDAVNVLERLVGFPSMHHPYAGVGRGQAANEEVFDFFYRHTFGRPRELTSIGLKVTDRIQRSDFKSLSQDAQKTDIRHLVHNVSHTLLSTYLDEIIPSFDRSELAGFMRSCRRNVITELEAKHLQPDLLKYYYNLGLIGIVRRAHNGELRQKFLTPATNGFVQQDELPESEFYLTHPCLDQEFFLLFKNDNYYTRFNVIGNGLIFKTPPHETSQIQDWIPNEVSGGRMFKSHAKHLYPLRDYYRGLFENENIIASGRIERFEEVFFERMWHVHHIIAHRMAEKIDSWPDDKETLDKAWKDLMYTGICRKHSSKIIHTDETTLILFYDRLTVRLIVAAMFLYFELSPHQMKSLVSTGVFDFTSEAPLGKSASTYLQNAFFLYGLSSEMNGDMVKRFQARNKLWTGLSNLEKNLLTQYREKLSEDLETFISIPEPWRLKLIDIHYNNVWKS